MPAREERELGLPITEKQAELFLEKVKPLICDIKNSQAEIEL